MMRYSKLICAFMVLAMALATTFTSPVYAAIFYAEPGGTGDGTAWNNTAELRVILASGSLNSGDQVWVKAGIYYPTDDNNPTKSFQLINGVEIYGGFSGFSASTVLADRDPETHFTALSGDIGARNVDRDNSFHVVTSDSSITASAVLDGLTITGGYSEAERWSEEDDRYWHDELAPGKGGGMFNGGGSPTLRNCNFVRNNAIGEWEDGGGGMFNDGGSPILTNCTFSNNATMIYEYDEGSGYYGYGRGGGMVNTNGSPTLTNCSFSNNTAGSDGGGMCNIDGNPTLTNCTFSNNTAGYDDGYDGGYGFGGGMANGGSPTLTNCTFTQNTAIGHESKGGGMSNGGSPTLTNCTFSNNTAEYGGGMSNAGNPTLTNCIFSGNIASHGCGRGGGMFNAYVTNLTISDCTFSGNIAGYQGGGMFNEYVSSLTISNCIFSYNLADYNGGGISNHDSSPTLINCKFIQNTVCAWDYENGGGGMANFRSSPTLMNCIFSENNVEARGGGILNSENSSPTITDCTFSGNSAYGGGGMFNGYDCNPVIINCTFSENTAGDEVNGMGYGGGMYNEANSPTITNCTFSGNTALSGGGMLNEYEGNPAIANCTFSNNSAEEGGGISNSESSPAVRNTIIANNSGGDYPDVLGNIISGGHNIIGSVGNQEFGSNNSGDQYGDPNSTTTPNTGSLESPTAIDPKLDLLYDNGGLTKTHTLQIGSPAIDAGDNTDAPATDQRGRSRIFNSLIDIGAVESDTDTSVPSSHLPLISVTPGEVPYENGEVSGTFTLIRTRNTDSALSVNYTLSGTATAGTDYTNTSANPITFASGVDTATITLSIPNDGQTDPNETIILTVAGSPDYVAATPEATLTIIDDLRVFYAEAGGTGTGKAWNDTAELRDILTSEMLKGGDEIWVKIGTYRPTDKLFLHDNGYPDYDENERLKTFNLLNGVKMYGGFSEFTASTTLVDRDPEKYKSILSGEFCIGPEDDFSWEQRSFHVVTADSTITSDTLLDGFTVTRGSGGEWGYVGGGGLYNVGGSPTVKNCTFTKNSGGMLNEGGNLVITGCTFSDNGRGLSAQNATLNVTDCIFSGNKVYAGYDSDGGGGIRIEDSTLTISGCTFTKNTDFSGGGIYSWNSTLNVTDCVFSSNNTLFACEYCEYDEYDVVSAGGGGIYSAGGTLTISGCTFTNNTVPGKSAGGGIHSGGGGYGEGTPLIMDNCAFTGNAAGIGGAIYGGYEELQITNCTFRENSATGVDEFFGQGGGLWGFGTLTNCIFSHNSAESRGGGMEGGADLTNCIFTYNSAGAGGGMFDTGWSTDLMNCTFNYNSAENGGGIVTSDRANLTNCTFSNNTADESGGGIYNRYGDYDGDGDPKLLLYNCTFTDNTAFEGGGIFQDNYYPALVLKNTIISGNTGGDYPDIEGPVASEGHNLIGNIGNYIFDTNTTGDQYGDPINTTTPNPGAVESATAIDPRLEPLADNGGPTQTHALLPDSLAINAGDNTDAPDTDQRGEPRILNDIIDIGAYESSLRPLTRISVAPGDMPDENGSVSGTFILTRKGDISSSLSVSYTLTGTATGADYTNTSENPVTFAAGSDTVAITLDILNDSEVEAGETIILTIGDSPDYVTGDSASATLTISDDVTVFYAESGGTGTGRAWNDTAELQAILKNGILNSGDEIWVKAGTYHPTTDDDRSATFQLLNGVKIYGGFAEFTESTVLTDRDPETHVTLLTGDIGIPDDNIDNSYEVITTDNTITPDTVLDGFIVTGGYPDEGSGAGNGSGMFNNGGSPTVRNCIFTLNRTGVYNQDADPNLTNCTFDNNFGGVANLSSSPDISDCVFNNNRQLGGIYNHNSSPAVTGCSFTDNAAMSGGGMHNNNSSPIVSDCEFTGNAAVTYDGDGGHGGGIFNSGGEPRVTNCVFTNNIAEYSGGGIFNTNADPSVTDCVFTNNTAEYSGGGMFSESSNLTLADSQFESNMAHAGAPEGSGGGGGMYNSDGSAEIIRCRFIRNSVTSDGSDVGGGMYNLSGNLTLTGCEFTENTVISENGTASGGGIFNSNEVTPAISDTSFTRNTAKNGGGIFNLSSSLTLTNCQFIENSVQQDEDNEDSGTGGGIFISSGSPEITDCLFSKNTSEARGGGMFNLTTSPVITRCTFSENSAEEYGGGMANNNSSPSVTDCTFDNNRVSGEHAYGGGMSNGASSSPIVTNCTFDTNKALGTVGAGGGGIANTDDESNPTVTNCTFSHNAAEGCFNSNGGGIIGSFAAIINCTLTGNTAGRAGGGIATTDTEGIIKNTIIAGNTGGDSPDISPVAINSGGHNLIGNVGNQDFHTNTQGDQYGDPNNTTTPNPGAVEQATAIDPKLGDLADNGGPTKTHALLPGSPATDAGDNADAPDTDQRGITRIVNGVIDIGAVEDASALPFVSVAPGTAPDETGPVSGTFILTRTGDLTQPLSVAYALTGTATGDDYSNLSANPIVFAPGAATAVITLNILSDDETDPGETVIATLAAGSDYVTGDSSAATLTIIADVSVYYAEPGADGTGSAWNDTADLRHILSRPLKSGNQIWLRYGTYYPTDNGDPAESFRLADGVEIYGGFNDFTASATLSDRNSDYYRTYLSGVVPTSGDTTHYVVTADSSVTEAALLDGVILMDWSICPIFRDGGNPTVTGCFFNIPSGYNEKAFRAVKDAYAAAQMYFRYHLFDEIDIEKLGESGFVLSDDRVLLTAWGSISDLEITAYHPCGSIMYNTDWTGSITWEFTEPAEDCGTLPENPDVVSVSRVGPERTDAASVDFEVVFSTDVTGADAGDFELSPSVTGAAITGVSGNGHIYTVSVNTGTGEGTLQLNFADDDSVISSCGDQPLGGSGEGNGDFSGQSCIIDRTVLTALITPVTPDPRTEPVSAVTIVFSEAVSGFDLSDLSLTRDGGENLLTVSGYLSTSDDITWTLDGLEELTGTVGDYALTLRADGSDIQDSLSEMLGSDAGITWTVTTEIPTTTTTTTIPSTTTTTTTVPSATTTTTTLPGDNHPPADITLNNAAVTENQPSGTAVGVFSAADPDSGDTHTYYLVTSSSGIDNNSFYIEGTTLKTKQTFDYEAQSTYSIYVRCNDNHGGYCFKTFTINIGNVNETPTSLVLSYRWVDEESPVGTEVGVFTTFGDPDTGNTHTYTLISGEGDTDNGLFTIEGNILKTGNVFDYETEEKHVCNIRVRTSDQGGLSHESQLTVTISDVNESPSAEDHAFSADENSADGTVIGTVIADDPESAPLTFGITQGNTDNIFAIDSTGKISVRDSSRLNYEETATYALVVQVSDGKNSISAAVTVNVRDVNEPPVVSDQTFSFAGVITNGTALGTVQADDEDNDPLSYSITEGNAGNLFAMNSGTGEITLRDSSQLDYEDAASYPLTVQISDGTNTASAIITVDIIAATCDNPTTESVKSGSYGVPATWSNGVPDQNDVVRINEGHRIYDAPALIGVRGLCNYGTLESSAGRQLHIRADDTRGFIRNEGSVIGHSHSPIFDPQYPTPQVAATRGDIGENGSSIRLNAGMEFYNSGTVRAGHGGAGYLTGGNGGSVEVYADKITHANGIIAAGDGGEANAHQPEWDGKPDAYEYGNVDVFGGEGGKTTLHAGNSLTTTSPAHTSSGQGGNSYVWCSSEDCQLIWGTWEEDGRWWTGRCQCFGGTSVAGSSPGRGGDLIMLAPDLRVLSSATSGEGLYYEPGSITAGPDTRIEAKDVFIFGGDDWVLNLNSLSEGAVSAANDITLSVGDNGVIDLRENWKKVFKAGGEVRIFSDSLLLEDGVSAEDVAEAEKGIETGPGRILYKASLNAPVQVSGQPGAGITVELVLVNAGPEKDTYALSVEDSAGWDIGELPSSVELGGLEQKNLSLNVTPPSSAGETAPLTIRAVSQTDPEMVAEIKVSLSVQYPKNSEGCYVVALEGSPFRGDAVIIPLNHAAVQESPDGQGISIEIGSWAEHEGIEDGDTAGFEIHGTDSAERIYGSRAKDMVYGYGGDDYLEGGDGPDVLDGGRGQNTLIQESSDPSGDEGLSDPIPGDTDGSRTVDLRDAILTLRAMTGMIQEGVRYDADVNDDKKIGIQEVIYILKEISE
ncbi:choice-of-anchor Q domain-containing protein [Desulfobacterales bacterium HSG2]|nr:choice-of-anchor Q domain-containing protein [Desulfobacterales bacterium HSG2]